MTDDEHNLIKHLIEELAHDCIKMKKRSTKACAIISTRPC